ncbi:M23 family metallopeptidase [Bdellovibrionales bacterium]|nr:M23 family metallopeptidase [Bdellovibrionales bacterium]
MSVYRTGLLISMVMLVSIFNGCSFSTSFEPYSKTGEGGGNGVLNSCKLGDVKFDFPVAGTQGVDWGINSYTDLDPAKGAVLDYKNKKHIFIDNHVGVDIDIVNFRTMEQGVSVMAAASGVVIKVHGGEEDLLVSAPSCQTAPYGNYIKIQHSNGYSSIYAHLRKNSIRFKVGDQVRQGDVIGLVGNSGCSTQPHLHFEVLDCASKPVAPFFNQVWKQEPDYDTPLSVLDISFHAADLRNSKTSCYLDKMINPPKSSVTSSTSGGFVTGVVNYIGGQNSDVVSMTVYRPNSIRFLEIKLGGGLSAPSNGGHTFLCLVSQFGSDKGSWRFVTKVNGETVNTKNIQLN